jgi:pyruvate dehydrogenase E1 component alpha subunit
LEVPDGLDRCEVIMVDRVIVPDLGATGRDVIVTEWLVQDGEFVKAGTPLFAVETDKAVHQVEAFRDGFVRRRLVAEGETVALGAPVAILSDTLHEAIDGESAEGSTGATGGLPTSALQTSPTLVGKPPVATPKITSSQRTKTKPKTPVSTAELNLSLTTDQIIDFYRKMALIRRYEDHLYRLFLQGLVPGTLHQCQGQEAVAVGVCGALRVDDVIFSTHRPVGHMLAKGASIEAITAEIWGKANGCAGGKGGQMHLVDVDVGAMPSNAIVGANIPMATGAAIGFRLRGLDRVAVSFFGDGASNIGTFHEGINFAAVRKAPVIFVCENNLYAASTPMTLTTGVHDIAERARSYGIPGQVVDGMDVVAVYKSAAEAVSRARRGEGPTLLEYKTYRYAGHSRGDPGNYRGSQEMDQWRQRDPIERCRALLTTELGVSAAPLEEIDRECQAAVEAAVRFAQESPEPAPATAREHVWAARGTTS